MIKNTQFALKAMGILGFQSFQSIDATTYEEICSAFLNKLMTIMKERRQAAMQASEYKNRNNKKLHERRRGREKGWRTDVVMINEAFQHLTRKKDKTEFAMKTWKTGSHQNHLITKTLDALALDPTQTDEVKEERDKMRAKKREESKQAQALALQIASHIDTLGLEKPKVQNGTKLRSKSVNEDALNGPDLGLQREDILDFIDQWLDDQIEASQLDTSDTNSESSLAFLQPKVPPTRTNNKIDYSSSTNPNSNDTNTNADIDSKATNSNSEAIDSETSNNNSGTANPNSEIANNDSTTNTNPEVTYTNPEDVNFENTENTSGAGPRVRINSVPMWRAASAASSRSATSSGSAWSRIKMKVTAPNAFITAKAKVNAVNAFSTPKKAKPLPSPNLKLKYQIQDESPEPTIPEPKKVVIPTLKERPKSSTLEVPKAEVISTPKFKPRPKTTIANVATTKIRMVKGKTVEVPPTPSKEHKIFEGKPPPTPSKGKWSKIDVSTIASAKMAMQAKVKRTSSSDKIKNTTLNNPLYVKEKSEVVAEGRVALHKAMKRKSKKESDKKDSDSLETRSRLESIGDDNVFVEEKSKPVEEKSKPVEEGEDKHAAFLKKVQEEIEAYQKRALQNENSNIAVIDTASEVDTETETSRRSSLTEDGDMISVSLLDKYLESDADGDKTPVEGDEYW